MPIFLSCCAFQNSCLATFTSNCYTILQFSTNLQQHFRSILNRMFPYYLENRVPGPYNAEKCNPAPLFASNACFLQFLDHEDSLKYCPVPALEGMRETIEQVAYLFLTIFSVMLPKPKSFLCVFLVMVGCMMSESDLTLFASNG